MLDCTCQDRGQADPNGHLSASRGRRTKTSGEQPGTRGVRHVGTEPVLQAPDRPPAPHPHPGHQRPQTPWARRVPPRLRLRMELTEVDLFLIVHVHLRQPDEHAGQDAEELQVRAGLPNL